MMTTISSSLVFGGGNAACLMSLLLIIFLAHSADAYECSLFGYSGPRSCPEPFGDPSLTSCCSDHFRRYCCNPAGIWVILGGIFALLFIGFVIVAFCFCIPGCPLNKWRKSRYRGMARANAAVLPTANFPRQAQPVSYPGQHAAYPGQQAAHPGQQAAHPGQQVAYPGQQVAYPGPQAVHPGQQAAYPVGEQPAAAAAAASAGAIAGDQPPSYDDIVSGNDYPVKPTHAEHVF